MGSKFSFLQAVLFFPFSAGICWNSGVLEEAKQVVEDIRSDRHPLQSIKISSWTTNHSQDTWRSQSLSQATRSKRCLPRSCLETLTRRLVNSGWDEGVSEEVKSGLLALRRHGLMVNSSMCGKSLLVHMVIHLLGFCQSLFHFPNLT